MANLNDRHQTQNDNLDSANWFKNPVQHYVTNQKKDQPIRTNRDLASRDFSRAYPVRKQLDDFLYAVVYKHFS